MDKVKLYEDIKVHSLSMKEKRKEIRAHENCQSTKKNKIENGIMFSPFFNLLHNKHLNENFL